MPQSLTKVYVHLVFSTKYREPIIGDDIKDELYAYLGGVCKALECYPVRVGGYYDHIHILCTLSKKIALMKLMEEVKKNSSKWIKTKGQGYQNFYWQDGYGAFSVNPSQVDVVVRYIENQYEHHRQTSFQDECRGIYKKYGMDYDERYVWD
ncbi:IS200/IS605 family transposase [Spirosoma fluviale]|uniref:REP element-mobilizing transposase RayT n=1 Tax=Spirosoma fluviale TaxID=1597977 RepID=A0A286F688_9BACT|nr:IS200/IS605 family transposase [Spirosoma fluviale]SOD78702.1 REP element-mobilizing transposase RayT [Spirosoma fluviale]